MALRDALRQPLRGIDAALDEALALPPAPEAGPVVLADGADNAGGGAPSDATFVLRRLLERGITDAALGPLWDPGAVRLAFEAGVGARLPLRMGGKVGPMSGDPVDAPVTVLALQPALQMTGLGGTRQPMGDCALVRAAGVDIVLSSVRSQAIDTDLFTQLGCALHGKRLVVVKSSQHFHAAYARIARRVVYVDAPGTHHGSAQPAVSQDPAAEVAAGPLSHARGSGPGRPWRQVGRPRTFRTPEVVPRLWPIEGQRGSSTGPNHASEAVLCQAASCCSTSSLARP